MSTWFAHYGFAEVHPGLVIGAYPLDAGDVSQLASLPVDRVLNLVQDEEYAGDSRAEVVDALAAAGIAEQRLELVDYGHLPAAQLSAAVDTVVRWLDEPGTTYLHCRAGWQRSAAVAAGAVAAHDGIDIDEALRRVRARKPTADPLPHQVDDLRAWWTARGRA
jgi:protein-tyrosine phosphatase